MDLESTQQQLEFLVNFAQTNIPELREGDWMNLCEDFYSFLRSPGAAAAVVVPGSPGILQSRQEAEAIQKEVYELLSELVDSSQSEQWEPKRHPISFSLAVAISRERAKVKAGGVPWLMIFGDNRDRALLNLYSLLCQQSTEKVARCVARGCTRIFYRVGKQRFCSTRCQSRESVRRFREKPDGKTRESEANHKRYKKRVEQKRGRPTRVMRRAKPRKN